MAFHLDPEEGKVIYAVRKVLLPRLDRDLVGLVLNIAEMDLYGGIMSVDGSLYRAMGREPRAIAWYEHETVCDGKVIATNEDLRWDVARSLDIWGPADHNGMRYPTEGAANIVKFAYGAARAVPALFHVFTAQKQDDRLLLSFVPQPEREYSLTARWRSAE